MGVVRLGRRGAEVQGGAVRVGCSWRPREQSSQQLEGVSGMEMGCEGKESDEPAEGDAAGVGGVKTLRSAVSLCGAGEDEGWEGVGDCEGGFHGGEAWCGERQVGLDEG